ncbi:MAG: hypothetical protein ACI9EW_003645, partial [Cellvibrionaceae bacterium]
NKVARPLSPLHFVRQPDETLNNCEIFRDEINLMMPSKPYRGSCLCQAVQFSVDEFLPEAGHCHCSMCRKFHGASFATLASVPLESFHWISGEADLKGYTAENGTVRTFCNHCGSSLFFSSPQMSADMIEVALGVFDDDIPLKPDVHIFVESGANWTDLADDLPKYTAGRDSAIVGQA